MSLRPDDEHPIPEATRRVARAAFPKGTLAMRLADQLGAIYRDEQFAALFPVRGQPALSPARLALVTVLQFVEGLSDRQAADAVRGRIDWKYALGLELTDPGFDHTVLSEFRLRLVDGEREHCCCWTRCLARVRELGLLKAARPAAHRLDPRAGGGADPQPARAGRRDVARGAERARRRRPGLAARPGAGRLVRALRRAGRELRPARERGGSGGSWPRSSAPTGTSSCWRSRPRTVPSSAPCRR